ncbi:MAG: 30S ribosomal protein S6 [Candidatus Sungbacteria bacterium]|nr:30S ribosomal protein S6 [Candidatus Sungbacteria bacterium]
MDSDAKNYEVAYILSPTLGEQEVLAYVAKLSALIEESGGTIRRTEQPKKLKLAYEIKKQENAYFAWTTFRMQPERIAEIEKKLKSHSELLRFLVVEEEIEKRKPFIRSIGVRTAVGSAAKAPIRETREPIAHGTAAPEDKRLDLEALDKKLEEILGK